MKYLLACLLCLGGGRAWGMESSMTWHSTYTWPLTQWHVDKGSETYTLKEFVESGRLCAFRGKHEWADALIFYPEYTAHNWSCKICGKKRKVLQSEQQEILEP